ncbi:MAG: CHASE3 domain-containing protein [Aulosira sp. ZfuVER01]|nr:CHASE3 domain-containing protein [Aulosira sp. ZfuVER01]MDZ8000272.1 CHASE3 domain-containing protein [Aulosira sp. DedVER01a]MDZ8053360.1 CHASE3 domain-containing protein [Aulosira sp. ZfuCHP01]
MQYNFKLGRVVTFGFSSVFLVMVVIGIVSKFTTSKLVESNGWVSHTYLVEGNLEDITKLLIDAETGQRGFMLTQKANYLEPYHKSFANFEATFDEVSKLIQDNPEQLARLNQVKRLAQEKMAELTETIELTQEGKRQAAMNIIVSNRGKQIMDEIRDKLAQMTQVEERLLAERQQTAKQTAFLSDLVSLGGTAIALLFGSLVLFFIAREIVRPINQVANAIASSSNEIAATVEQQERTATQQAISVNETTTTINQLSASAQQSAQQAETASISAQQVLNLADRGNQTVTRTLEGMIVLSHKVNAVADQMLRLNEQTMQIGSISELVSDLANQTNMLALNAAVEAVRAGEQGKGFAIVAAEIRKLADQSKKSAQKINGLVNDIQSAINLTVTMTDESTKTAAQGAVMTEQTVEVFADVTNAVSSMVLNIQQISLNAKQQATAVEQILQVMNSLNVGAKETASGISQTRVSTHQLNDAADKLQAVV